MDKETIIKALQELRKSEKRKFPQTVDLIINLRSFDIKRESVNLFVEVPHKIKDKKICAFLNKKSPVVDTITKENFEKYKGKSMKKFIKKYDFFVATGALMPAVATNFGRFLGPAGKMPSPQLGILTNEDEKTIQNISNRINKTIRVKSKEPSLKMIIGKENMKDEDIAENILTIYNSVLKALPRNKENLRNVMIKLTMTKPVKIKTD